MKQFRIVLKGAEYKMLCTFVHTRDQWKCRHCKNRNNLHSHHIIFRSQGGDDADYNLITLCDDCHDALHARYLLILSPSGEEGTRERPIDANKPVRFIRLNGWVPGKRRRATR